jgi:hypothetical protein
MENHAKAPTFTLLAIEGLEIGLRSHIGRRANIENSTDLGLVYNLAETKIDNNGIEVLIDYDIGGFEVSMKDVLVDQVTNSLKNLAEDMTDLLLTQSL